MAKDLDLFKAAMAGVAPLKGRRTAGEAPRKQPSARPQEEGQSVDVRPELVKQTAIRIDAFDRDIDRALARGRRAPEASLDLHGLTLAGAERAVSRFLADCQDEGQRLVLIVTGKGLRLEGGRTFGGRIRGEFPGWLERPDNRKRVAGYRAAHPRHGGSGAFYVLLRRR